MVVKRFPEDAVSFVVVFIFSSIALNPAGFSSVLGSFWRNMRFLSLYGNDVRMKGRLNLDNGEMMASHHVPVAYSVL